jgi:DNA gyrase/topoisomerase IV subunit B
VVSIKDRAGALFVEVRHALPPPCAFDAPPSASFQKSNRESLPDKLHDANLAGSNNRLECTLILTEGDSAAAFAVRGPEVIGREFYGVLPLRGKIVNPRTKGARTRQDCTDPDLLALMSSMGLCHETRDRSSLRYGQVISMSDSDLDGYRIRGLIINYIRFFWPWLMAIFLKIFVTPCVVAIKGVRTALFYHLQEYRNWRSTHSSDLGWDIRYIKGLASLTTTDASKCIIMKTDADVDGIHIRGLFFNLIQYYCPSILENYGFISFFVSPCVIACKLSESVSFFKLPDYRLWSVEITGWNARHINGLASLSTTDTTELFSNFQRYIVKLEWNVISDAILLETIFIDWLQSYVH